MAVDPQLVEADVVRRPAHRGFCFGVQAHEGLLRFVLLDVRRRRRRNKGVIQRPFGGVEAQARRQRATDLVQIHSSIRRLPPPLVLAPLAPRELRVQLISRFPREAQRGPSMNAF